MCDGKTLSTPENTRLELGALNPKIFQHNCFSGDGRERNHVVRTDIYWEVGTQTFIHITPQGKSRKVLLYQEEIEAQNYLPKVPRGLNLRSLWRLKLLFFYSLALLEIIKSRSLGFILAKHSWLHDFYFVMWHVKSHLDRKEDLDVSGTELTSSSSSSTPGLHPHPHPSPKPFWSPALQVPSGLPERQVPALHTPALVAGSTQDTRLMSSFTSIAGPR